MFCFSGSFGSVVCCVMHLEREEMVGFLGQWDIIGGTHIPVLESTLWLEDFYELLFFFPLLNLMAFVETLNPSNSYNAYVIVDVCFDVIT